MTHMVGRSFATVGSVGLLMVASLLLTPTPGAACSCIRLSSPCASLGEAAAIFVGTVATIVPPPHDLGLAPSRIRFQVGQTIKGVETKVVEITTAQDTAACGFPFQVGVQYLVYALRHGGELTVSLCSRTGALASRRDDLALLTEVRAGKPVRPRVFGSIYRRELVLDGFYHHFSEGEGLPGIPVRIDDGTRIHEATTDADGRFSLIGVRPGTHKIEVGVPKGYAPLYDRNLTATVDGCSGQTSMAVTTVPLRGSVHPPAGTRGAPKVMLRLSRVDADGVLAFDRSTLAFTEADGTWTAPGLPAGRYVVGVSVFDPPSPHTPYPTFFYASATRPEDATTVEVSDDRTAVVDFRLPARIPERTLTGVTITPDGAPVARVSVNLYDTEARPNDGAVAYATSDASGQFLIVGLTGRRYRIQGTVVRPGGGQSDLVNVPEDATPVSLTLVIKPRPSP